jgi:hypothetical protein
MRNSVAFRFGVAALLASAGCLLLLTTSSGGGVCFGVLPVLTMSRSEMRKPIPSREILTLSVFLIGFVALILACKFFIPSSTASAIERVIRHPAFVLPFWLLLLWSLHRIYRRQKGQVDV